MITVHFFAAARDAAGTPQALIDAPPTLTHLKSLLATQFPGNTAAGTSMEEVLRRCTFLLDGAKATDSSSLVGVTRVDVLPPFAGG